MAPSATTDVSSVRQESSFLSKSSADHHVKYYASILHKKRELHLEEYQISSPEAGELQIEIKVTGICGSDVSYYQKRQNGDIKCAEGAHMCLGHESSGEVVAVGPQVKGFKIKDRVALEVGVPCGSCTVCRKGRYNLCKKMRFRSSAKTPKCDPRLFQGTLQQRINHPAMWCHKIPDNVSFEAAALLEPLSVAMHATNRAALSTGSTALVIGAGTVGLLTAAMARQAGCTTVTIMDVDEGRVEFAIKNNFATHGYTVPLIPSSTSSSPSISGTSTPNSSSSSSSLSSMPLSAARTTFDDMSTKEHLRRAEALASDVLAKATNIKGEAHNINQYDDDFDFDDDPEDAGVDCTFECTGKEACMQTALYATKPGGRVIMVGMGTPIQTLPLSTAHLREIDILGIFRYCNTYAAGIRLLESKRLPSLDNMVTHRRSLRNADEAFELAGKTKDGQGRLVLKVVIQCSE